MNNSSLAQALAELRDEEVASLVRSRVEDGNDPLSIVEELRGGMNTVGERFRAGTYFLSELILSGEIFKQSMTLVEPLLKADGNAKKPVKLVLGTAKGDIHDIGKDIVAVMLRAAGFEVHDVGIDAPPAAFVDKLRETGASVLGMSGLLTPTFPYMKETVDAVKEAGLRDNVKIIIGGGIVTEQVCQYVGADAWTTDAVEGVRICKAFEEVR